jgi:hypothetical protein
VSTPREPREPDDSEAADAAWRSIIDNYGERPQLDEPAPEPPETPVAPIQVPPSLRDLDGPREARAESEAEGHFVPPPPPPLPSATPPRLLAWVGLFGVPMLVLVAIVAGLSLPPWLGLILMVWFVGGFVYLVASMRPGPRDDYDDGAVL